MNKNFKITTDSPDLRKFEELTEEEQKKIKKAMKSMLLQSLFNGVNHGALIGLIAIIAVLANETYLHSTALTMFLIFGVTVYMVGRMAKINLSYRNNLIEYIQQVAKK